MQKKSKSPNYRAFHYHLAALLEKLGIERYYRPWCDKVKNGRRLKIEMNKLPNRVAQDCIGLFVHKCFPDARQRMRETPHNFRGVCALEIYQPNYGRYSCRPIPKQPHKVRVATKATPAPVVEKRVLPRWVGVWSHAPESRAGTLNSFYCHGVDIREALKDASSQLGGDERCILTLNRR